jgi:3-methyl-2-oxobutanoate hydroxymethyltransferase
MLQANDIKALKGKSPIVMITAYDACFARMAEAAQVDMILVGDSVANVVLGFSTTRDVGMEEMLMFVSATRRGAPDTHIVADMPWRSDVEPEIALKNAQRFVLAGANSVKIEGACIKVVRHLRQAGIEVVGHLGLLPQTATSFRQHGQSADEAEKLLQDAIELEQAGVCALVLEHIPERLGAHISQGLQHVPTIGIGAGNLVDGQVLVLHDALGLHPFKLPPFAHKFVDLYAQGVMGLEAYAESVRKKKENYF